MSDFHAQKRQIDEHFKAVELDIETAKSAGAELTWIADANRSLRNAKTELMNAIEWKHERSSGDQHS